MAFFTTNSAVNFNTDFWLLQELVTGTYENTSAAGFTVDDDAPLFESVATVTGSGFTFGAPPNGTINGIELKNNFGGTFDTYTITGLNLNLIALKAALATSTSSAVAMIFDGDDTINGSAFNDVLRGYDGIDWVYAGAGNDNVDGGDKNDHLFGQDGDDYLFGGNGNDQLTGNNHNDTMYGGANNDSLAGDNGDDFAHGGAGIDSIYGGDGNDTASFSDKSAAVVVTLNGSNIVNATVGGVVEDNLRDVENVNGGSGGDSLTGDGLANILSGNSGDDVLVGNGGADTLNGGLGSDSLYGGDGNDTENGFFGNDTMFGEAGDDTMNGGNDNDAMDGGIGNDIVNGDAGNDNLFGALGSDTMDGGTGDDNLHGGFGLDFMTGGAGSDGFFFETKPGKLHADHITDFDPAFDTLMFDHNVFKKVNDSGMVKGKFFEIGKHADDANDFFVYNAKKATLCWDKDGDGDAKQKVIAYLDNAPDLTKADLFMF